MKTSSEQTHLTGYHFHVDTTPAIITFNNNLNFEEYTINLSDFNITCSDINLDYCYVSWDDGTITNSTTENITGTKTFTFNGNHTFNITAVDIANNHISESGEFFIDPRFTIYFNNNTDNLQNFTINGVFFEEFFFGNIYDYGLTSNNFTFQKSGFQEIDFQLNFTNNYTNLNQT